MEISLPFFKYLLVHKIVTGSFVYMLPCYIKIMVLTKITILMLKGAYVAFRVACCDALHLYFVCGLFPR